MNMFDFRPVWNARSDEAGWKIGRRRALGMPPEAPGHAAPRVDGRACAESR